MANERRPADLGNDQFFIRTTTEGVMTDAGTRVALDLTKPTDRAVIRRMAIRMLDMCDWFDPTKRNAQ